MSPLVVMKSDGGEVWTEAKCLTCQAEVDPGQSRELFPQWATQHAKANPGHRVALQAERLVIFTAAETALRMQP